MKIGILVDTLAIGGAERQAILCVSELRKLGHAVDLLHYHPRVEFGPMLNSLGISPCYVGGISFAQRCCRLRRIFKDQAYDVVHGFKMAAEIYVAVAGTWARVPRKFGSCRSVYQRNLKLGLIHSLIDKFLDAWIVNSRTGAESMITHTTISPRKVVILRNALAPEILDASVSSAEAKRALGLSEQSLVVSLIARLEPEKNHFMFISAAARIHQQLSDLHFLVVGKGRLKESLMAHAASLGLNEKMHFLGERSDIPRILAATDVSVLTSNYEGMPNAIIEAMAAGKPILCTNYRGHDEIMTHGRNALITPSGDADALAMNLLHLLRNEPLRRELGRAAYLYARDQFAPEIMARNLEQIYQGAKTV